MHDQQVDVCVSGLGYIGLPTACVLARSGLRVHGVDVNDLVVEAVGAGQAHLHEPGLDDVLSEQVRTGRLSAGNAPVAAPVHLIAVPTPFDDQRAPDLGYVRAAADAVAPVLRAGDLVILESTSPPGTTEALGEWLAGARPELFAGDAGSVRVAYCPERVLPGHILDELVANDRVVGGLDDEATEAARGFYRSFVRGDVLATDSRTAEMTKLAENSFRDVNIAFANALSMMCADLGVDVRELISFANRHPRVNVLRPGPGVGGHCIAVDPWFLVHAAGEHTDLLRCARETNEGKQRWTTEQIRAAAARSGSRSVALFGLAYKPNSDDLRESPAVAVAEELLVSGEVDLTFVEPHLSALPSSLATGATRLVDVETALAECELFVLLVAHDDFAGVGLRVDGRPSIDFCGLWEGAAGY